MQQQKEPEVKLEPLAVKRTTAADLLDCGPTTIWKLEKAGKLDTIKVGKDTRITMESIRRYVGGSSA
jgi:hypothetical protein